MQFDRNQSRGDAEPGKPDLTTLPRPGDLDSIRSGFRDAGSAEKKADHETIRAVSTFPGKNGETRTVLVAIWNEIEERTMASN